MRVAHAAMILVLIATVAQAAPRGHVFLKGLPGPAVLGSLVKARLAADPSGRSSIVGGNCKPRGCATPYEYLLMVQRFDPERGLESVEQLPDLFAQLKAQPAPEGEYWMACRRDDGPPEPHCKRRRFNPGEMAWVDPLTRRVLFASGCGNPVERRLEEQCARVRFSTDVSDRSHPPDTSVRFTYCGPAPVASDCWGTQEAGQVEVEKMWADKCQIMGCSFLEFEVFVEKRCWTTGSFEITESGDNFLYVPGQFASATSEYITALCLDRGSLHGNAIGVYGSSYSRTKSGVMEAVVWPSREEVPRGKPLIYWPWDEVPHL